MGENKNLQFYKNWTYLCIEKKIVKDLMNVHWIYKKTKKKTKTIVNLFMTCYFKVLFSTFKFIILIKL
jgi:hypothetical protein